jgi:hypothetical protein
MNGIAALAAKEAAAVAGLGVGLVPGIAPGAVDGFAIGTLLSGLCFLMVLAPHRKPRRTRLSGRRAQWMAATDATSARAGAPVTAAGTLGAGGTAAAAGTVTAAGTLGAAGTAAAAGTVGAAGTAGAATPWPPQGDRPFAGSATARSASAEPADPWSVSPWPGRKSTATQWSAMPWSGTPWRPRADTLAAAAYGRSGAGDPLSSRDLSASSYSNPYADESAEVFVPAALPIPDLPLADLPTADFPAAGQPAARRWPPTPGLPGTPPEAAGQPTGTSAPEYRGQRQQGAQDDAERATDGKLSDGKLSDGKLSDGKVSDGKVSDSKVSDNRRAGRHAAPSASFTSRMAGVFSLHPLLARD